MTRAIALAAVLMGGLSAQAPATRTFDVVSIKTRPGPFRVLNKLTLSGPRLMFEAISIRSLIIYAYSIRNDQLVTPDDPALFDVYYDIAASAEGDGEPTKAEFQRMLQVVLADRFKLKMHSEMRETPVYHLVIDKSGQKFTESAPDTKVSGNGSVNGRNQIMDLKAATMQQLARDLAIYVDRPVLDKTGLTKSYDFKFEATPFGRMTRDQEFSDLSAFTAIRSQLGLRLDPAQEMVEKFVVDQVSKPTEN